MPGFLTGLPIWAIVLIVLVLVFAAYKYWMYKKSIAYAPNIARGSGSDFTTPRDNPKSSGAGG